MFSCEKGLSGNQAVTAPDYRLVPFFKQFACQLKNQSRQGHLPGFGSTRECNALSSGSGVKICTQGEQPRLASGLLKWSESLQHTRNMTVPFKKIAESLGEVLPVDLADDVKKNVRAMVQSSLEKMDLVTREELEVQEKVLARTRSQLEALQQRVTELEEALKRSADP